MRSMILIIWLAAPSLRINRHLCKISDDMDSCFFAYLQQLELMAFFSGYPLVYLIVFFLAGDRLKKKNQPGTRAVSLLPFAYALLGMLYLGLQLKSLYPDYTFENIKRTVQYPYLTIWGLFPVLFWIPAFCKKPYLSVLHSFTFFLFLVKDLFYLLFGLSADRNIIRNDPKIYTASLFLTLLAFALIASITFLLPHCNLRLTSKSGPQEAGL